jgi:hypothetical protein
MSCLSRRMRPVFAKFGARSFRRLRLLRNVVLPLADFQADVAQDRGAVERGAEVLDHDLGAAGRA